ncbi:MAG TPA: zinc ribbon domain-containing protein [Burkholderiaceae bacterium]|nr:zinc ribbon domain-containing protein [Burkholderiaceae bacterium]
MPLYDFHCPACGRTFEALVRGGAAAACPACGSGDVERCVARPAPPGRSAAIVAANRRAAAREGHVSNYSAADRAKAR